MTESLPRYLLRLSEAGDPADLLGRPVHCAADERTFDYLLRRGVLIEQRAVELWDPCATCNCGADDRPIRWRGELPYAACRLGPARDTVLDADDLATFRIMPAVLAAEIAEATGLPGPVTPVLPGVWHLGELQPQLPIVVTFARGAMQAPGLITALRAANPRDPIILLGPAVSAVERGRWAEADIHAATLADMLCDEPLLSALALALDRARLPRGGATTPRLVIDRRLPAIVLDGARLDLPRQPHALLLLLAECAVNGSGFASISAIHAHLYGRAAVASNAHNDVVRELRGKLKSLRRRDGLAPSKLVETITGQGLRLNLAPGEIEITGAPRS